MEARMGQEYWVQFENRKKVETYLKAQNFPKDHDKKTVIIESEKGKVDCWLSWHGQRLDVASQIFDDQSAWCCAITLRLIELFGYVRVGADSTGWWEDNKKPHRPFWFTMKIFKNNEKTLRGYRKLQRLFIAEAKRLLPEK